MAYERIIKVYQADGTTLVSTLTNAIDCKFNLGMTGGCLGGEISLYGTVRDDYAIESGAVIKCFYSGSTPIYSGIVTARKKSLKEHRHTYELEGAWSKLGDLTAGVERTFTGQTIGAIASAILADYIVGNVACVSADDSLIASSQVVESFTMSAETPLDEYLPQLALMAGAVGGVYAIGINADLKMYLVQVSATESDIQGEAVISKSVVIADEQGEASRPRSRVAVIGDVDKGIGLKAKKTFSHDDILSLGVSKPFVIKVPGVTKENDLGLAADGWFERYSSDGLIIDKLARTPITDGLCPIPWLGQYRYTDTQTGDKAVDYFGTAKYIFGEVCTVEVDIGLTGTDDRLTDSDEYSPTESDPEYDDYLNDVLDWPEATDLTPIDSDVPHMISDDQIDAIASGGQSSAFYVIAIRGCGAAQPSDQVKPQVELYNGEGYKGAITGVTIRVVQLDSAGDQVQSNILSCTKEATGSGAPVELWIADDPFTVDSSAAQARLGAIIDFTEGPTTEYWPADISASPELGVAMRIIDGTGGGGGGDVLIVAGWAVDGS